MAIPSENTVGFIIEAVELFLKTVKDKKGENIMQPQKMSWPLKFILLSGLVWGLAGCGGQNDSATSPEPEQVVETSVEAPAEVEDRAVTVSEVEIEPVVDKVDEAEIEEMKIEEARGEETKIEEAKIEEKKMDEVMPSPTPAPTAAPTALPTVAEEESSPRFYVSDIPFPADAQAIKYDSQTAKITFTSLTGVETLAEFYRQALAAEGWQENEAFSSADEVLALLVFNQGEATTSFTIFNIGFGNDTEVTISPSGFVWDNVEAEESLALDTTNLPLPADAREIAYDPDFEEISFMSDTDVETLAEFYRQLFTAEGWFESVTITAGSTTSLAFDRDESTIKVDLNNIDGTETEVLLTAYSFSWDSPDTSEMSEVSFEVSEADESDFLPYTMINGVAIPPEVVGGTTVKGKEVTYLADLDFAGVVDFYRPALADLDLETGCLEDISGLDSISCSISNGRVSMSFFLVKKADDQTKVSITLTDHEAEQAEIEAAEAAGTLSVVYKNNLIVPHDYTNYVSEGSQLRQSTSFSSPSDLETVLAFYRRELTAFGWQEQTGAALVGDTNASLTFENKDGTLTVELSQATAGGTDVHLNTRLTAAAEAAGVLPQPGQARLLVSNFAEVEAVLSIDGQEIKLAPMTGVEEPDGPSLDLAPGHYTYTLTIPNEPVITDTIDLGADETWALLVGPGGAMPLPVY